MMIKDERFLSMISRKFLDMSRSKKMWKDSLNEVDEDELKWLYLTQQLALITHRRIDNKLMVKDIYFKYLKCNLEALDDKTDDIIMFYSFF